MADIRIESPEPDDNPDRRTIEEAIRDYAGVWRALIRRAQTEPWWVVQMERTDGEFKRTFLLDLREQTPAALQDVIRTSLKGAV
jgi:hypothetical protein